MKRRPIKRKSTNQNAAFTPSATYSQPSNPIGPEIPSNIRIISYFEHLLEQTLYIKPRSIAYFCLSVSLILSLFATYFPFIRQYTISKENFLNVYFVKFGWGWTLAIVGPYVLISSAIYTLMEVTLMAKHLGRLVVSTAMWYFCTQLFDLIQEMSGECSNTTFGTIKGCLLENNIWNGYDVSGHCFLLTFCLLVTVEEFKTSKYIYWDGLSTAFEKNNRHVSFIYENSKGVIFLLKFAALILIFIWQWMLITSSLFFHTFSENLSGTICGIVAWWSTYIICFHEQKYLTFPGDGVLGGYFREYTDI